jgi:hypothetical protein
MLRQNKYAKEKCRRFTANIDKETAAIFLQKLADNGEKFQTWLKKEINKYIENNTPSEG